MASVNRVTIIGNLGKDPEVRSFANGGKVCNLRVACSEQWKDKDGNRQERTEWVSVSIQNDPLIRVAEQYLRKGSKVYLEGKLETKKYQAQDGSDRYSTEVVLRPYRGELVLLDGKGDRDDDEPRREQPQGRGPIPDDEIPFRMEWR